MKSIVLSVIALFSLSAQGFEQLFDQERNRVIPIHITQPDTQYGCDESTPCPVAMLSSGYGIAHTDYHFLTEVLVNSGYMVVAIQHELPNDPPLSRTKPFIISRAENWKRGTNTLHVVRLQLASTFPDFRFDDLLLIGHSNGGDISAWFSNETPSLVSKLITLDHRRVPLPRQENISVLSIRASDFEADPGVLPTLEEDSTIPICVHKIPQARHNDMSDSGPTWLKEAISLRLSTWLENGHCEQ